MRTLQTCLPDEIADAIEHEAETRSPLKTSVSRVLADVIVPAFQERATALQKAAALPSLRSQRARPLPKKAASSK